MYISLGVTNISAPSYLSQGIQGWILRVLCLGQHWVLLVGWMQWSYDHNLVEKILTHLEKTYLENKTFVNVIRKQDIFENKTYFKINCRFFTLFPLKIRKWGFDSFVPLLKETRFCTVFQGNKYILQRRIILSYRKLTFFWSCWKTSRNMIDVFLCIFR